MNPHAITVVGTPQGFWTQWVNQMLSRLEHANVHVDVSSSQALDTLLGEPDSSKTLVLVEHPAIGLARRLREAEPVDPQAWLGEWLASGRALLEHAQRHPVDCLLVNADDARRHPQKLAQLLRSSWDETFVPPAEPAPGCRLDPLANALAWSFVDRNLAVQDLAEELLASCVVLPGDQSLGTIQIVPRGFADDAAATKRLSVLLQVEQRFDHEQVEIERRVREAEVQRDLLDTAVRTLRADGRVLVDRADRAESALDEMRLFSEAVDRERLELASRLEAAALRESLLSQALEESAALTRELAEQVEQQSEAQALAYQQATAALDAMRAEHDLDSQRKVELTRTLEAAKQSADMNEAELSTATREGELLFNQLYQVQEELEKTLHAKRESKERARELTTLVEGSDKQMDRLRLELNESRTRAASLEARLGGAASNADQERRQAQQAFDTAAAQLREAEAALAFLRRERDTHKACLDEAFQLQAAALARAGTGERELASAKEEGALLLRQLHQVHEELERALLARHDDERAAQAVRATAEAESKRLDQELRDAREESELLTLQTNAVQRELERVHAEKVALAREAKTRIRAPGLEDVTIGEVVVLGERDAQPHREVSFMVRDVRTGSRQVAEATVRLVEHWGRPGLAVFLGEGSEPLFRTWRETGREDGRPYMLLVHGEEQTHRVCDAMGTLDWQLLLGLSARLHQVLQDPGCGVSTAWQSLAERLLSSLQELPAKLRHENVLVMPIALQSPAEARWGLMLEGASYRGRNWPRLTILWRPNAPQQSIELVRDARSGPPLLAWPSDEHGAPVAALRLPVSENASAPEFRSAWDALSGPDRGFVAEILNLIPIFAVHVQAFAASSAGADALPVDLQAAARSTVLIGRLALQPSPTPLHSDPSRRLLQRVARRLRGNVMPVSASAVTSESNR